MSGQADSRGLPERIEARLRSWQTDRLLERMLEHDPTLWAPTGTPEIEDRLGWLDLPSQMIADAPSLTAFAREISAEGFAHVVVLGMGGSSLAPEVFQNTFGNAAGYPRLTVLDSTHPTAVSRMADSLDISKTLLVVSSKSGTTTEMLSFLYYFSKRMTDLGIDPGSRTVAITDPGTPLETLAGERGFRRVFPAPPDVGGRYSALSVFGLVPAALIGVDIARLLGTIPTLQSDAVQQAFKLGATLGEAAPAGRDKLTFVTSPALASFPTWIEQLIAESTGKLGGGIVPIDQEPTGDYDGYGDNRVIVYIGLGSETDATRIQALRSRVPDWAFVEHIIDDVYELGSLMMQWEIATAAAGAALGINPFDQPDVQLAKDLARAAMSDESGDAPGAATEILSINDPGIAAAVAEWLSQARPDDYIGIHLYLAPDARVWDLAQRLRGSIGRRARVATTSGYGPRFLHSTGQLHKGGPASAMFLQIVDDAQKNDIAVPETTYTFGQLIAAQSAGDAGALAQRGRRLLRITVGDDAAGGLDRLAAIVEAL